MPKGDCFTYVLRFFELVKIIENSLRRFAAEFADDDDSEHTEEEARYLVEQGEEDTYVNASGGLTGVSFETNMITTFATVLSNTTKEGQFWERVFSTSDIVSGGTYMIVSAEGGFALRGNESNNYSRVMVQAQDGEEDPDAPVFED